MHSPLALAHQRMAPRLLLDLGLRLGEGRQQARRLLDQRMMHPRQAERTMTSRLHTEVLRLLRLQPRPQDMEMKQQHQRQPKGRTENHCVTIGLTHRHHDMTLPPQPQAPRHLLHMEAAMMRRRQQLGLETGQDISTAMRSKVEWILHNGILSSGIACFAASSNLASERPARTPHPAVE